MEALKTYEGGPVLILPKVYYDARGLFFESFNDKEFKEKVTDTTFVQDNESHSAYGVVRGMHYQTGEYAQAKLVRVVKGSVIDVVVDMRKDSPYYKRAFDFLLSDKNKRQLFVPRGFAHGFVALEDDTIFQYKCDNFYNKASEGSFFFADPEINIPWNAWVNFDDIRVSDKDKDNPLFEDAKGIKEIDEQEQK